MRIINNSPFSGLGFADLLCGIGGYRLALESLGAKCVYSCEKNKWCREVYEKNFNDTPEEDICSVVETAVPDHDILCSSFPGLDISNSVCLFNDIIRIVKAKKPKVIILENGRGFIKFNNGASLSAMQNDLNSAGYSLYYSLLNASDYGLPHHQVRSYFVAFRDDLGVLNFAFPSPIQLNTHLEDYLLQNESAVQHLYINRPDLVIDRLQNDVYSDKPMRLGQVRKGSQGERVYSVKGVAIGVTANGGGAFSKTGGYMMSNGKVRRLHEKEVGAIMGFPENFQTCSRTTQTYVQFGNAVVVDVIQYIGEAIADALVAAGVI